MTRQRKHYGWLATLVLACLAGGCTLDAPLDVWVASEMVNLTDRTASFHDRLIFDTERRRVNLFAGANETVSFQLVIDAGSTGARGVGISFSAPARGDGKKIDRGNIRAFQMLAVKVDRYPPWYLRLVDESPRPAGFYDALVPLAAGGDKAFDIAPGGRLAFWLDVRIPPDALPGEYIGELKISSRRHGQWTAALAVQVYDFVLPNARPIAAVGGFDHSDIFSAFVRHNGKPYVPVHLDRTTPPVRRGLTIMRQLMRLAHDHRLDLFDKRIRPVMKRDMFGAVRLMWDDYDAIVMPYLSGSAFDDRVGCSAWPVPVSEAWPDPRNYGGQHSDTYASTVGSVLAAAREHFSARPETSERMFIWPFRGPVKADAYARDALLARIARAADTETPILTRLPPNPPAVTGWSAPAKFERLADIFAPPAQLFDPSLARRTARAQKPLVGVWLSPGVPPYLGNLSIIASPADVRAIPWFAMKYGCAGLFLPEVLNWNDNNAVGPSTAADGPVKLFYPASLAGTEGVLPSARLKRLRRGLQDIAYLWILRQRGRGGIASALSAGMTRYAGLAAAGDNYLDPRLDGWVHDPATWQMARRLMAEEVQAAVHPTERSNRKLLAERLAWKMFYERTHTVRVEQIRSRVTPAPAAKARANKGADLLSVTITLELYNEYSRDVDLAVKMGKLPEGWRAITGEVGIRPFPAATRRIVTLRAEGNYLPTAGNAKLDVPVSITTDMHQRKEIIAPVPFIVAAPAAGAIKIDGRLEDWPMRIGNTAADFKLIGRRGRAGKGLAQRQTLAFVLRDQQNLYIAFRCEEPDPAALKAHASNIIHYSQLMAWGEDMVEVILDPGADAASPEELYHIVVKANGVLLTERGVRTDPPLGQVRPWPVSAVVATSKGQKLWIAELAVPLSAFGPEARARYWGANFTRFATAGAEASSWSEAPRYFYHPRNLGTMFVAPIEKP